MGNVYHMIYQRYDNIFEQLYNLINIGDAIYKWNILTVY